MGFLFLHTMAIAGMPYRTISENSNMHIDHNKQGVLGDTWLSYGKVTGFNVLTIQDVEYELKSFDAFTIPKGVLHGVVGNGFREYKAIDSVTGLGVGCADCDELGTQYNSNTMTCEDCPSGTYQDDNNNEDPCFDDPCKSCLPGTYQDEEGQSQCKTSPEDDDSSDDDGLSSGAIAGIAVGSAVGVAGIVYLIYRFCQKSKPDASTTQPKTNVGALFF